MGSPIMLRSIRLLFFFCLEKRGELTPETPSSGSRGRREEGPESH